MHMQREVDRARQQQDAYKATSRRLERTLQALRDQVRELQLESVKPHLEDNKYTRQIRTLENKLDRAMIKLNEAQAIKRTYEQIVRRLREERVSFDTQVEAIERSHAAKQKDYEELLLLSGDANHARELSLHELERVKAAYETEREQRERSLKERLQVVQLRKQMLDRIKQREKMREEIAMKLNQENPQSASATAQQSGDADNQLQMEKLEKRQKIDIFENAFRKIKDATGVSDVNEVIQKIVSQESTTESLMSLTKENQAKLEMLNQQKQQLKTRVEEIKVRGISSFHFGMCVSLVIVRLTLAWLAHVWNEQYSGPGGGHRRKMVDDNEQQLANSTMRLERAKLRYERLNRTVIAAKAGVAHLQDKLEIIREELGGKKVELFDETVADVLYESEILLTAVLKRVKAAREEQRRRAKAGDPRALVRVGVDGFRVSEVPFVHTRVFVPAGVRGDDATWKRNDHVVRRVRPHGRAAVQPAYRFVVRGSRWCRRSADVDPARISASDGRSGVGHARRRRRGGGR